MSQCQCYVYVSQSYVNVVISFVLQVMVNVRRHNTVLMTHQVTTNVSDVAGDSRENWPHPENLRLAMPLVIR